MPYATFKNESDLDLQDRAHLRRLPLVEEQLYIAQNLRKHHVSICAKKKVISIFHTKKVKPEKQKIWLFLINLLENSPICKLSHLTLISETNSSHSINTACDMLHQ